MKIAHVVGARPSFPNHAPVGGAAGASAPLRARAWRRVALAPLALACALMATTGCAGRSATSAAPTGAGPQARAESQVYPGDSLTVVIFGDPEKPTEVRSVVNEQGAVVLPELGVVAVSGQPLGDARARVREMVVRRWEQGQVELMPKYRVTVFGQVASPGVYYMEPGLTIIDAIAKAGGVKTDQASGRKARLIRNGRTVSYRIDRPNTPSGALELPALRSGDQVFVPKSFVLLAPANLLVLTQAAQLVYLVITLRRLA